MSRDRAWKTGAPLALFLILNLVVYLSAHVLGFVRPYLFDLDYAVATAVLAWPGERFRWLVRGALSLLVMLLLTTDIVVFGSRAYIALDALSEASAFVVTWPWKVLAPAVMLIAAVSLFFSFAAPMGAGRRGLGLLTVTVLALLAGDIAGGRNVWRHAPNTRAPNLASSPLYTLSAKIVGSTGQTPPRTFPATTLATGLTDPPARILSVAVESLGVLKDSGAQSETLQPLIVGLGGQYRVRQNLNRPFIGGTLSAEIRELCGLDAGYTLRKAELADPAFRNCLPARLQRLGYDTIALHGNDQAFYSRNAVYRAIGFQQSVFKRDLLAAGVNQCRQFVFEGVCDQSVFENALGRFSPDERQFVHIMTLDNHLPLSPLAGACGHGREAERMICLYRARMRTTLAALSSAITTAKNPPDLIVIYGDHTPPFSGNVKSAFREGVVPYIELERLTPAALGR